MHPACPTVTRMSAVNGFHAVFLLLPVLLWALGFFVLYWVIRLAVRHGILDARGRQQSGPGGRQDPGDAGGPA